MLYSHVPYHNDTIIKTQWITDARRKTSLTKHMYLSLYCKGSKRVTQGLRVRGSWRSIITAIFWPPLLWPSTLCLSRSPRLINRRPRGSLGWMMAFFTASDRHLLWTPIHQGPKPFRAGVAFPTISRLSPSPTVCNSTVTGLNFGLDWAI